MSTTQEMIQFLQSLVQNALIITPSTIIQSLIVVAAVWLLRYLFLRIALDRMEEVRTRYQWQKISTYITTVVTIILLGPIWLKSFQSFVTYIGLLTAGVAIALRDPLSNLAGWSFIVWRRPFNIGDRIEIDGHAGDVVDIRLFEFSLAEIRSWVDADQSTGRIIHVPNSKVLTETMANFSQGIPYVWHEIPVLVTFESDWQKAKEILLAIAEEHTAHLAESAKQELRHTSRKYMLIYNRLTPTVYTSVEGSGVLLTIRCLSAPRQRRGITHEIWEDVLMAFMEHEDIEFAYPTQRLYMRSLEEEGARTLPFNQ